jgi:hypothetical protein
VKGISRTIGALPACRRDDPGGARRYGYLRRGDSCPGYCWS